MNIDTVFDKIHGIRLKHVHTGDHKLTFRYQEYKIDILLTPEELIQLKDQLN